MKDMNLRNTMASLRKSLAESKLFLPVVFGIVAILSVLAYMPAREVMTFSKPYFYITKSNITLNFVLFLFLWGVVSDWITRRRTKWVQWLVFAGGLVVLILFFRFVGGFPTIFG